MADCSILQTRINTLRARIAQLSESRGESDTHGHPYNVTVTIANLNAQIRGLEVQLHDCQSGTVTGLLKNVHIFFNNNTLTIPVSGQLWNLVPASGQATIMGTGNIPGTTLVVSTGFKFDGILRLAATGSLPPNTTGIKIFEANPAVNAFTTSGALFRFGAPINPAELLKPNINIFIANTFTRSSDLAANITAMIPSITKGLPSSFTLNSVVPFFNFGSINVVATGVLAGPFGIRIALRFVTNFGIIPSQNMLNLMEFVKVVPIGTSSITASVAFPFLGALLGFLGNELVPLLNPLLVATLESSMNSTILSEANTNFPGIITPQTSLSISLVAITPAGISTNAALGLFTT